MQQIIRHLFQVDTLEEVPRERLEELVGSYPSFGVGRYLLSRKLQTENAGHFSEETQKTNLYFSNPFWLQWLLQNEVEEQRPAYTRTASPVYTHVEEPAVADDTAGLSEDTPGLAPELIAGEETSPDREAPIGGSIVSEKESVIEEEEGIGEALVMEADSVPEEKTAPMTGSEGPPVAAEAPAGTEKQEFANGPVIVEEPGADEELAEAELKELPPAPLSAAESLLHNLAEARELRQSLAQMNEAEEFPEELPDEELAPDYEPADFEKAREAIAGRIAAAASETSFTQPSAEVQSGIPVTQSPEAPSGSPAIPATETPGIAASASQSASGSSGSSSTEAPTAIVSHAMALAEPIVMFEPYHTIDYFASVGIKFVQDDNPQDKLGKQLKSFTEWLKVMRKLPQKNQEIVPDVAAEHQIQAIAAHSIKGKEVLTETMAEVLGKQGMREKAMEVYHKLSLLNPDKSAYFAAKIEQLKID